MNLGRSGGVYPVHLRLESATGGDRNGATNVSSAAFDELASLARPTEPQILTGDYFCYRETIMDLSNIDVLRLEISHLVGLLCRLLCCVDGGEAIALVQTESVLGLPRTDNVNIIVAELLCKLRRSQDETTGSVSYERTIIQLERPGHHTRFHDFIHGHLFLHVRLRIQRAILVILHCHRGHLFLCSSVLMHVDGGHEGKEPRECHAVPLLKRIVRSSRKYSCDLRGRLIRHLLNTPHKHNIIESRLDRHNTAAKS